MRKSDEVRIAVGLPPKPFLYTLDQISTLTGVPMSSLKKKYVFFDGLTVGRCRYSELLAINIAPEGERPDWRVDEVEFMGWLKYNKFRITGQTTLNFGRDRRRPHAPRR